MITTKPIKCRLCAFETPLRVRFDEDGLASQMGWEMLRDHYDGGDKNHKAFMVKLRKWIDSSTVYKLPQTDAAETYLQSGATLH